MFEIVSIADGNLLTEVLNGVAMITNNANFEGMVAFGLLCGLLLTAARALVTQRLELQYLLVGWLMFATMYGPRVNVTVEDLGTGTVNAVNNVPIGVAAVGTVSSIIGLNLAETFATVFNLPSAAGSTTPLGMGFADPLSMLVELRDLEYGGVNDASATATDPNIDVQRSVARYLKDCVLYAIGMEGSPLSMSWEELRTAPNLLTAIEVPAVTWHTVTYLTSGDPDGVTRTCAAAYTEIAGVLGGGFANARFAYLGSKMNIGSPQLEVQAALDYFFGAGRAAQDLMLNALLSRELELASVDYQATAGNSARVMMLTQAIEQRRTQWAAEKTLFEEVAQPLMAYIEAFFYAVSPIMAFVFVLGQFGMKLFGRYLMLAAWIQLWIPIMAVNNLYIHHSAAQNIQSLASRGRGHPVHGGAELGLDGNGLVDCRRRHDGGGHAAAGADAAVRQLFRHDAAHEPHGGARLHEREDPNAGPCAAGSRGERRRDVLPVPRKPAPSHDRRHHVRVFLGGAADRSQLAAFQHRQ